MRVAVPRPWEDRASPAVGTALPIESRSSLRSRTSYRGDRTPRGQARVRRRRYGGGHKAWIAVGSSHARERTPRSRRLRRHPRCMPVTSAAGRAPNSFQVGMLPPFGRIALRERPAPTIGTHAPDRMSASRGRGNRSSNFTATVCYLSPGSTDGAACLVEFSSQRTVRR